MNREAFRNRMQ
jgi:hypothetical protein